MTQLGELVMVGLADEVNDDKCPFCYKARHAFPTLQAEPTAKVVSKPGQLACAMLPVGAVWSHTTAKHHLISAMQCYARVRRLVRMASMVKYDINDPPNGLALPTVANNIRYTVGGVEPQKFGAFDDGDKQKIAFGVMEQAKAQWHVGHHAFTIDIPDDWAEEDDKNTQGHEVSYDESVISLLLKIMDAWVAGKLCEKPDDQSDKLKADMDAISKKIKAKLDMFATSEPKNSDPFFVSRLAFDFAKAKARKRSLDEADVDNIMDGDPPPQLSNKKFKK